MEYGIETRCIHGAEGVTRDHSYGSMGTPIYQTATFSHPGVGRSTGYDYSRESRNEGSYESDDIGGFGDKWYDKLFRYVLLISIAIIVGAVLIFVLKVTVTVVIPVVVIVLIIKFLLDLFRRY